MFQVVSGVDTILNVKCRALSSKRKTVIFTRVNPHWVRKEFSSWDVGLRELNSMFNSLNLDLRKKSEICRVKPLGVVIEYMAHYAHIFNPTFEI